VCAAQQARDIDTQVIKNEGKIVMGERKKMGEYLL